jgi:hypothetical protein
MSYVQDVFQKIFTVLARIMRDFKNISVNNVNVSLHLITLPSICVPDVKGNTLIAPLVVNQLFFIMTILITQTSVALIKNAIILLKFLS